MMRFNSTVDLRPWQRKALVALLLLSAVIVLAGELREMAQYRSVKDRLVSVEAVIASDGSPIFIAFLVTGIALLCFGIFLSKYTESSSA